MQETGSRGIEAAVLTGLLVVLWLVHTSFEASLRNTSYAGGWALMALLAVLALALWRGDGRGQGLLSMVVLALFIEHMGFGLPEGGFEILLAVMFVVYMIAGMLGRHRPPEAKGAPLPAWRRVQASLTWGLLGFAFVHGVLMHAHGLLAWWLG